MFVDWTVNDATAANTATTLSAAITLNLYNANIATGGTDFAANGAYTFAPYLTVLNTVDTTIVTNPFDAIVIPFVITVDGSGLTINVEYNTATYPYTTPDWHASDYNTLTA